MKKTILFFLIYITYILGVDAQNTVEHLINDLSLNLKLNQELTSSIEPIFYQLEVKNNADTSTYKIKQPFGKHYIPELQFFNKKNKQWQKLYQSDLHYKFKYKQHIGCNHSFGKNTLDIAPKDSINNDFVYLPVNGGFDSSNYLFEDYKQVLIRAVYYPLINSKKIEIISNTIEVKFKSSAKNDRKAQKWLSNTNLPHAIFEYAVLKNLWGLGAQNGVSENELKTFIQQFPNSSYTNWAKIQLTKMYILKGKKEDKIQKKVMFDHASKLLEELKPSKSRFMQQYIKPLHYEHLYQKLTTGVITDSEYLKTRLKIDLYFKQFASNKYNFKFK